MILESIGSTGLLDLNIDSHCDRSPDLAWSTMYLWSTIIHEKFRGYFSVTVCSGRSAI